MNLKFERVLGLCVFALVVPSLSHADELDSLVRSQMETMVKDEYEITHKSLQNELSIATIRSKALQKEKADAISKANAQAKQDQQGIDLFKKYDTLLMTRYADKTGQFQSGLELAQKDVDNLNDLLRSYLSMVPLSGRISAGYARTTLSWASDKLDEARKAHTDPTESNNPALEIITKQSHDLDVQILKLTRLAELIGFALNPNAPVVSEGPRPATSSASDLVMEPPKKKPAPPKNKKKKAKKSNDEDD